MDKVQELQELLEEELKKLPDNLAVALSGGLDSSIIACLMKKLGLKFKAYVVGIRNSEDIRYAREQASRIGVQIEVIEVDKKEIEENMGIQKEILLKLKEKIPDMIIDTEKILTNSDFRGAQELEQIKKLLVPDRLRIAVNLPLFFVAKNCKEKNIVLGQGGDELFGGYLRYLKLEDVEKEMKKDAKLFLKIGMKQNEITGEYWKKKFLFPYYDKKIMNFADNLDLKLKINNGERKIILKKLAEKLNLRIREKKAMQYGSGIGFVLQKLQKQKK